MLPYMEAHKIDPTTGEDEMALANIGASSRSRRTPRPRAISSWSRVEPERSRTTWGKVGRNEACPCGSGKKYKHCHGQYV